MVSSKYGSLSFQWTLSDRKSKGKGSMVVKATNQGKPLMTSFPVMPLSSQAKMVQLKAEPVPSPERSLTPEISPKFAEDSFVSNGFLDCFNPDALTPPVSSPSDILEEIGLGFLSPPLTPTSPVESTPSLDECEPSFSFQSLSPDALCAHLQDTVIEDSYLACVRHLIETLGEVVGTSVDQERGWGIAHYACAEGNQAVLEYLQETSTQSIYLLDGYGNNTILLAALYNQVSLIPFLVKCGVDPLHCNNAGFDAFHLACNQGNGKLLTALLDSTPDFNLNERDSVGCNLLHDACAQGNRDIVEILIRRGSSPLLKNNQGQTALLTAVKLEHSNILDLLIDDRSILEIPDRLGRTPLHWAAAVGNLPALKFLIKSGANIEQRDRKGRTPFLLASFEHHIQAANFLKQKKALISAEDYEGRSVTMA